MTLNDGAAARTDGSRHIGHLRNRLLSAAPPEPRYDYRNEWEASSPVAQRINDFIARHFPNAVCDRCICEALDFYSNAQAVLITEALGTTSDFDRRRGECVLCRNETIVIRATRTSN
jgi:hypothetical protein